MEGSIAGIVLASGMSHRFGVANKLLAEVSGVPVIRRSTVAYVSAALQPIVVVVGYQADAVRRVLSGLPVAFVNNPEFEKGQSQALVRGLAALPDRTEAAVIGVGDQPWLQSDTIGQIVTAWRRSRAPIVAPLYDGERGNPVLFARALFGELAAVEGDVGGRPVIAAHLDQVVWVSARDIAQAADIDVPADLRD